MPQKPYNEYEKFKFCAKNGLHLKAQKSSKDDSVNPGDMVTRTGDREIGVVSGRLPDNPGELACMRRVVRVYLPVQ